MHVFRSLLAVALLWCCAACGSSSGACVEVDKVGALDSLCHNDWDEAACNKLSPHTFASGQSCSDLGYTKACSSSEKNCYCIAANPYCP